MRHGRPSREVDVLVLLDELAADLAATLAAVRWARHGGVYPWDDLDYDPTPEVEGRLE